MSRPLALALLFAAMLLASCTSEDVTPSPASSPETSTEPTEGPAGILKQIECRRADENTFGAGGRCWRLVADSKNQVFVTTTVGDPQPGLPAMVDRVPQDESFVYIRAHGDPLCLYEKPPCGRPSQPLWVSAKISGIDGNRYVSIEMPPYPVGVRVHPGWHHLEIEADDRRAKCPGTINVEAPPEQVLYVDVSCLL